MQPREHKRRYNARAKKMGAIIIDSLSSPRDIVLNLLNDMFTRISDTHWFYDALEYSLTFCKVHEGYHFDISKINPHTGMSI